MCDHALCYVDGCRLCQQVGEKGQHCFKCRGIGASLAIRCPSRILTDNEARLIAYGNIEFVGYWAPVQAEGRA